MSAINFSNQCSQLSPIKKKDLNAVSTKQYAQKFATMITGYVMDNIEVANGGVSARQLYLKLKGTDRDAPLASCMADLFKAINKGKSLMEYREEDALAGQYTNDILEFINRTNCTTTKNLQSSLQDYLEGKIKSNLSKV